MNDIATTSARIKTSAKDRLVLEQSKIGEVLFVPSRYAPTCEPCLSCGAEPRRHAQSFVFTHEHEIHQRDPAPSPFSHHPTMDKECSS